MPYHGKDHNDYVNGAGFCCAGKDKKLQAYGGGIGKGNEEYEKMQYYYHADHLGSSSYITNLDAQIVQHVEYVPFGEVFIEERNQSWNTPYLFNGKELDEETGLYYYGARYYNPRESVWLSVDPMAKKYPNISPYAYTFQNPIKYTDPTGMEPDGWGRGSDGTRTYSDEITSSNYKDLGYNDYRPNNSIISNARIGDNPSGDVFLGSNELDYHYATYNDYALANGGTDYFRTYANGTQFGFLGMVSGYEYDKDYFGSNGSWNMFTGNVGYTLGKHSLQAGVDYNTVSASIDSRIGGKAHNISIGGRGSFLSAKANGIFGLLAGENGETGFRMGAEAYGLEGEFKVGIKLFNIGLSATYGASAYSAHIGGSGGLYINKDNILIIEGMENIGLGIGEKLGGRIEIDLNTYKK